MVWKSAQQTHWVLVALTTLAAAILCGGGLSYEASRSRALHEALGEQLPQTSRAAMHLLESLRMRSALAAALDLLEGTDGAKLEFDSVLPQAELSFLQRTGDAYKVFANPLRNASPHDDILSLPIDAASKHVDQAPLLWPRTSPQSIAFCSQARVNRIACASLPLATFLSLSAGSSALGLSFSLSHEGKAVARTARWDQGDQVYEEQLSFVLGEIPLSLSARADQHLKDSFGISAGQSFAAGSVAVCLAALAALFAHRRSTVRRLALQQAIERSRLVGADLVRASLRNAANSAGILVWLAHEDERLELIGPWFERFGIQEGDTTLSQAVRKVRDEKSVRAGIAEAMRERKPWARVLLQDIDGETKTYQVNCAPLFDADGNFVAMLGVTTDVTEALRTQSQVMRDNAYRKAQLEYLGIMVKEVSGAATSVQAVIDLLTVHVNPGHDSKLQRLLGQAATEAWRLSEVMRGSLELLNLRTTGIQGELRTMRVDDLIRNVTESIAAREGVPRNQTAIVEGFSGGLVMVHQPSLVSMLSIVLTNAMRYSPLEGLIEVRLKAEESALHIEVEDSGPGMQQEELARLGEPFFRGASSRRAPGSGLGIALCRELANHTRSSVSFVRSSNPERGLLATISLPWAK